MKIERLDVFEVGFASMGSNCFVRLTTDTGITGLGQSGGWGYPHAVAQILAALEPVLVGADPFRIEHLWHVMYRARPFRGNLLSSAVAAVDNALWDIKGKALQAPVWDLLGGRTRDKVRLHTIVKGQTPDAIAAGVRSAAEEGFTAVKFDPLFSDHHSQSMPSLIDFACAMTAAAREGGGAEMDLILDVHRQFEAPKAAVVCNALAQFRPLFIEDPLQIDSISSQAQICRDIAAPVALGERLSSIWEFRELLGFGVPMILRPDVGMAGGLSQARKIAALAEAYHCGLSPHNFLGPGLSAPTLHLCVTISNLVTMEYLTVDEDPASLAIRTSAVREGGFLMVPDAPGLGIELADGHDQIAPITDKPIGAPKLRADGSVAYSV